MSSLNTIPEETLQSDAKVANSASTTERQPKVVDAQASVRVFSPYLYDYGPTRLVLLDLSAELGTQSPATTPALLAQFLRIRAGEELIALPKSSGALHYVARGQGGSITAQGAFTWSSGDVFALPTTGATHYAVEDVVLFSVDDSPLLSHLKARRYEHGAAPVLYRGGMIEQGFLNASRQAVDSSREETETASLVNRHFPSISETLTCEISKVPPQTDPAVRWLGSASINYVIEAAPDTYTLIGKELDVQGAIKDPIRVDWQSGGVFMTLPNQWCRHVNASDSTARLLSVQDAALHSYLQIFAL